jgi:hypothetical protein
MAGRGIEPEDGDDNQSQRRLSWEQEMMPREGTEAAPIGEKPSLFYFFVLPEKDVANLESHD